MTTLKNILKKPSLIIIIIILFFVIGVHNNQSSAKNQGPIKYDVISYYSYLPAFFVEHDLSLSFITEQNKTNYFNENKYWPLKTKENKNVIKTTMGMSVLYAPFFLCAHLLAEPLGYNSDGFSYPYTFALLFSGLFYLIIGLLLLRKSLLKFYSEQTTAFTLFAIYFASNLLCYSTLQAAYSHEYSFFLFSALLSYVIKWHEQPNWKNSIFIGLIIGLLTLVRIINISFILVFLLYDLKSFYQIKHRIIIFLKYYYLLIIILLFSALVFLPQILYWKYISGHFFFNSYLDERFYFTKPHILQCLIGFRKGWLIYSPVFFLSLLGSYFMLKKTNPFTSALLILFPLYFYLISSWWCWWYGGSFGLRSMIDIYPLLTFPMAAYFESIQQNIKSVKWLSYSLVIIFTLLNCFQTIQFHYNIIHYDSMTFKAYKNRFFKLNRSDCDKSLLAQPNIEMAKSGLDVTGPVIGE